MTDITLFEPVRPAPRSLQDVYKEIRQVYKQYPHPWVVGYSGGKDSTTVLQMIWYALAELPESERTKPVYVISSDTLVETPMIVGYIDETLRRINEAAAKQNMPFTAQKLVPQLEDTFWINLIGKGYPAPSNNFRWCTDRLKIKPSNRFILSKVTEYGEVILALGIRRGESSTRDQVINMHRFTGHKLARHGQLPGAWVYMPLEHFTTEDIWQYLLQVPSPWGNDNSQLAALYRSAQSGECPLVIDKDTASCGNSRFGCWTCTVVSRDRSMEAMIDGGQDWMIPLLEFRDWLATTQEPDIKPQQREYKGRDGRIKITPDGKVRYRTYRLEFSKGMLRRLLLAQREVQQTDPDFVLISEEEIREIRRIWMSERQDWEDTVPSIYAEVNGRPLMLEQDDVSTPGRMEAELLDQITAKHDLPLRLVQKLLDMEWQHYGMRRRTSIHSAIEKVLREDWRTLEEARADVPTILETADLVLMAETEE